MTGRLEKFRRMYRFHLGEPALEKKYIKVDAADLDRQTVGQAFLKRVIGDPSVRAGGERLCLACPIFDPLFKEGKFPIQILRRRAFTSRHLPAYANVGYPELKKHWPSTPKGALSGQHRTSGTFDAARPPNFMWHHKWPVVLDPKELAQTLSGEDDTNASYWPRPFKDLISNTVSILADQHQRFFDLLRTGQLVAEGIFSKMGQELPMAEKEWGRPDRYLDVQTSDLLKKQGETFGVLWESLTLRRPNQDKGLKPGRARPVDQALERELKKRGLADGRNGRTDSQIAYDLVDQRLTGEALQRAVDKKRQQLKRYYHRRGCS